MEGVIDMTTSDLILRLEESLRLNGDIDVEGIVNGKIIDFVDINVPDDDSPLYLEFVNEYNG